MYFTPSYYPLEFARIACVGNSPFFSEYLTWLMTTGRSSAKPAQASVSNSLSDFCSHAGVRWPNSDLVGLRIAYTTSR